MIDIIVAFLISVLMGMGVGGGGLFVIYLTLVKNCEQITSQGTNLIFFILAVSASVILHIKKRKINFYQVAVMSLFGVAGSLITSVWANSIDPKIPRIILGIFLTLSGIIGIFNTFKSKKEENKRKNNEKN